MSDNSLCPVCGFLMKSTHRGAHYCDNCRLVLSEEEHAAIRLKNSRNEPSSSDANPDPRMEKTPPCKENHNAGVNHSELKAFSPKDYGFEVCSKCGAGLSPGTVRITNRCPFCNNQIDSGTRHLKPQLADFIIPFEINTGFFLSSLKESIRNIPFLPDVFRNAVNSGNVKIEKVYVPCWLFNIRTEGTVNYDVAKITEAKRRGERYRHTIRSITKTGTEVIRNLQQKATPQIDERIVTALAPYKTEYYQSLNPKDLSDISQHVYDFEDGSFSAVITKKARKSFENSLMRPQDYDYHHVSREEISQTPEYIHCALVPIIHIKININGETMLYAMNGQSGKTYAELPISDTQRLTCILSTCFFLTSLFYGTFTKISMYASTIGKYTDHYHHSRSGPGVWLTLGCILLYSLAIELFATKIMKFFSKSDIHSLTAVLAMSAATVLLTAITVPRYLGNGDELIIFITCSVITFAITSFTCFKTVNNAVKNANKNDEVADTVPNSCISIPEKREEKTKNDVVYERIKDSAKPAIPDSVITNPEHAPEAQKERIRNISFAAATTVVTAVICFLLWNSLR